MLQQKFTFPKNACAFVGAPVLVRVLVTAFVDAVPVF